MKNEIIFSCQKRDYLQDRDEKMNYGIKFLLDKIGMRKFRTNFASEIE